ncbi:MAG: hypothetical protein IIV13_08035, partial [Bacteroidaceae bacterium]|nr:hypothetical protein [Bacteroidaceae bacterium]
MKRIAFIAFTFLLIAVCVLLCAFPGRSVADADHHECVGEGCLLCIVFASVSRIIDRLASAIAASTVPT